MSAKIITEILQHLLPQLYGLTLKICSKELQPAAMASYSGGIGHDLGEMTGHLGELAAFFGEMTCHSARMGGYSGEMGGYSGEKRGHFAGMTGDSAEMTDDFTEIARHPEGLPFPQPRF